MFKNLFTKVKEKVSPITVEQIHKEFLTASDKLLEEANKIINQRAIEKAERLKSAGFVNANEIVSASVMALTKYHVDCIEKYRLSHPNNKFIRHDDVLKICEKYNLIIGAVDRYKGFVPDEKLRDIENFKLPEEQLYEIYNEETGDSMCVGGDIFAGDDSAKRYVDRHAYYYVRSIVNSSFDYSKFGEYAKIRLARKISFLICAPQKDMIVKPGEKIKNFKITIPDPVVLCPAIGGYLIVAAWGDEASDPIVVNEKMN